MNPNRKTAIFFGILLIFGIVFGILNTVPALEHPDYLVKLFEIKTQVLWAMFFQFTMASVYVGITVVIYPIIKKFNEGIALWYFGFRIIGAAFLYIGIVSLMLLLFISQSYITSNQPDPSYYQTIAELLRVGRDGLNHIGMVLPWSIGGLILFYSFFRMNLVPKWLTIWGIIGYTLTLMSTILLLFEIIKIVTPIYFVMNTPTALLELILAGYLIIKGFNPTVIDSNRN
jgi:hypothetical protein